MSAIPLHCQHQLNLFRRQYLQLQAKLTYPDPRCLRLEAFQQALLEDIFNDDATDYQPPKRHKLRILKELVGRIEASITDWEEEGISDGLVSKLATLLASPIPPEAVSAQQRSYVTYTLSNLCNAASLQAITLLEARSLVAAAGTTGFRTWDACLHLGVYLSSPSCAVLIAKRNVLELGAGTGYLSILCARYLDAAYVTATDGSDTLVADMSTNFYLNGLQNSTAIHATDLKWGHALLGGEYEEWNEGRQVDVVLGADVTYDSTGIPALIATLDDLIELFPSVQILIAATIRHGKTFETFLGTCAMIGLRVEDVHFPVIPKDDQQGPFYSDSVPIRICSITKNQL